jgi:hypothetical protein
MQRLQARTLFVCGDLFEFKVGDRSSIPPLWDEWDRYVAGFTGTGRVEWVVGGHEFWGGTNDPAPRGIFLRRYPDRIRSRIFEGDHAFLLFDDVHDPECFDTGGLAWLDRTLQETSAARHIWFFGHVPPRNTADWWPEAGRPSRDAFRVRMAQALDRHPPRAAFFGHEHMESYLGDPGGWPMFGVGCRWPLLVEVAGAEVRYRWIMNPLAADPLAGSLDALTPTPVACWQAAVIPRGAALPALPDFEPASPAAWHTLRSANGTVDLAGIPALADGDRVLATAVYTSVGGWQVRHARLRSDLPFSLWVNGLHAEDGAATAGRFRFYLAPRLATNRVAVLLDVAGPARSFTYFRHGFARELQLEGSTP